MESLTKEQSWLQWDLHSKNFKNSSDHDMEFCNPAVANYVNPGETL